MQRGCGGSFLGGFLKGKRTRDKEMEIQLCYPVIFKASADGITVFYLEDE